MATNFVKVDASHYERLVKDSHTLEQIRKSIINRVCYSKYWDGEICLDHGPLFDDLKAILDRGTLNDMQIRYNYLREQYMEREKEASENAETKIKE